MSSLLNISAISLSRASSIRSHAAFRVGILCVLAIGVAFFLAPAAAEAALIDDMAGKRVLFVGAHPDDETIFMPLLAEACLHKGATCTLFVATRGELFCKYTPYAGLSCAQSRTQEMNNIAGLLEANLIHWQLPNGGPDIKEKVAHQKWNQAAGSATKLLSDVDAMIRQVNPEIVLTMDPRHGLTCHPEHLAMARLVFEALRRNNSDAEVLLWLAFQSDGTSVADMQSLTTRSQGGTIVTYDANRKIPGQTGTFWSFVSKGMAIHKTQFSAQEAAQINAAPSTMRIIPFLKPASSVNLGQTYCSGEDPPDLTTIPSSGSTTGGSSTGSATTGSATGGSTTGSSTGPVACARYSAGSVIPSGYGVPWNVIGNRTGTLINAQCTPTGATVTVGTNDPSQYIYADGYAFRSNAWQPMKLTGVPIPTGWLGGVGTTTLPLTQAEMTNGTYIVSYVCTWNGSAWKCGCRDNVCSGTAANLWQLQLLKRP